MYHVRIEQIRRDLEKFGWDALVCRLPENVLFLSHYWPISGFSVVVCPVDGDPFIIAADLERDYMLNNRIEEVRYYQTGTLDAGNTYDLIGAHLRDIAQNIGLRGKRIAFEASVDTLAPPLNSAEPGFPSQTWRNLLMNCFDCDTLYDAVPLLNKARSLKDEEAIAKLQVVHEISSFGLQAFVDLLEAGRTEAEVASAVESAIAVNGHGYKGTTHVRAWAQLMSGERSASAYSPFPSTSSRMICKGDIAVLELAVCADGYWADVTRTRAVGFAGTQQQEAFQALREAHLAIRETLRHGINCGEADQAARAVIEAAGFGRYFIHATGHGLGWKYHEPIPLIQPHSEIVLQENMVTSVEPGIYLPGQWGMRLEENVVIGKNGPHYLSTFTNELGG